MDSFPIKAVLGGLAVALAAAAALAPGILPTVMALASAGALAGVAFAAQSRRLRDERRLVYRPVYARRQAVQRRVRSDD